MSSIKNLTKNVARWIAASALVGCAAIGEGGPEDEQTRATSSQGSEGSEITVSTQALGNFSQVLPKRGSDNGIVQSQFLSWGMLYAMQLRTGALVDSVSASFYTPSNPDNRFSAGDAVFTRGPVGGTAGSPAPLLQCPGGYAAQGLYGSAGLRVDLLGLICTQIGADGKPVQSTQKPIGAYGGSGGTFFYDLCADGEWLSGVLVQAAMKSSGTNKIVSSVQGYCASAR